MADVADASRLRCERCGTAVGADDTYCPECGMNVRPNLDLPGFSAVSLLGTGGAADVYLARQDSLDRKVAVKLLRPGVDDERSWRAFQHEARTVGRLSGHPNVVTVYTAGRAPSGRHYLVTEYLDRGSLDDVIAAEGPLPPIEVARIGVAIADALIAAHELGIHHRDVKPGNVLLGSDGRCKLADFGIARLLAGHTVNTTDVMAFTPEHVAPEVLRSEPDGPWSDLYGLASTLATALLGEPPLRRLTDERMDAYLTRKLTSPAPDLPEHVPRRLAVPITAALAPDPAARPTMIAFRTAMAGAVETLGRATTAGHVSIAPGVPRLLDRHTLVHRRRRLQAVAIALVVLVLAGGVAAALLVGAGDEDEFGAGATAVSSTPGATATPGATSVVVSTTSPVTTPAATTVAVPLTTPTTQPAQTTVATTTLTPVSTTLPPPPDTLAGAQEVEAFILDYYAHVADGDYEVTWNQLAPEFIEGRELTFDEYVEFWEENDVEVSDADFVSSDEDRAIVRLDLRWNGRGPRQTDEFVLRRSDDGQLLIVRQTSV
jgi:hypothetical protein